MPDVMEICPALQLKVKVFLIKMNYNTFKTLSCGSYLHEILIKD